MAKNSHSETAYAAIKQRIMDKRIVPGQLIFETELAKSLNMSRTPVREAIKRLEAEGLFEVTKGKGTVLRSMTIELLINCYELSEGLEGMLAFHLAQRKKDNALDPAVLDELDQLIDQMDQVAMDNNIPLWVELDTTFHNTMHQACTNPFLLDNLERLQTHFNSVSLFVAPMYFNNDKDIASAEHRKMVRYIREGKPVKAREAAQQQRMRIRNFMINLVGQSKKA